MKLKNYFCTLCARENLHLVSKLNNFLQVKVKKKPKKKVTRIDSPLISKISLK